MSLLKLLVKGTVAGFTATFPMSAVMMLGRELLPQREQYWLPPSQIVSQALMIIAHIVWGSTLGVLVDYLSNEG